MDNKKKVLLLISGILAIILVCVILVGLLDGFWPWQNSGAGDDYTGMSTSGNKDTTGGTGETTLPENSTAEDPSVDSTKATSGGSVNNGGAGSGANSGSTGTVVDPDEEDGNSKNPDIEVEIEDPTTESGSTGSSGSSGSTGNKFTLDELLGLANNQD